MRDLVEDEIGKELALGEIVAAAGAVTLVIKVGDDAHVAEAVPARRQEGVLYHPHAYRAQ